ADAGDGAGCGIRALSSELDGRSSDGSEARGRGPAGGSTGGAPASGGGRVNTCTADSGAGATVGSGNSRVGAASAGGRALTRGAPDILWLSTACRSPAGRSARPARRPA